MSGVLVFDIPFAYNPVEDGEQEVKKFLGVRAATDLCPLSPVAAVESYFMPSVSHAFLLLI